MLFWNGSKWTTIASGSNGQKLIFCNGIPSWGGCPPLVATLEVTSILATEATAGGHIIDNGGASIMTHGVCWNTSGNPTLADSHTSQGLSPVFFNSLLTGLTAQTTYYIKAYATNIHGTGYGNKVIFNTLAAPSFTCGITTITDYDNNSYNTVQIGTQCWMRENLNIGDMINGSSGQTDNGTIEKYCYDDDPLNCYTYGGLIQWNEMMQYGTTPGIQGICPTGWHLPSDVEWCMMTTFIDAAVYCNSIGSSGTDAGGSMKEMGVAHWMSSNVGATNSSGFTGLPGAYRNADWGYSGNAYGYFWSSSQTGSAAYERSLFNFDALLYRGAGEKINGYSVRCVKNN
ncbi:MAG: hypothetical protein NTU44_01185 [Bacteroidetes bacterium]|nr:hypothetical protein [Bacteroidota bacterium]